ncbi:MAG: hypothetical protein WD981_05120 [Gaiellaceae bacterium]
METQRILETLFAAGVVVAAGTLGLIAWGVVGRATAAVAATLTGAGAATAWAAFGLDPSDEYALAAGGLTACFVAALAGIPLVRALARGRRIDAEIARGERRLRDVVAADTGKNAEELERLLARARADTLSQLAEEERRIAEERRRELAERERTAGAAFTAALADAERRVETRLSGWAEDLERAQNNLAAQLAQLLDRQKRLIADAETRIATDVERLASTADEEHAAITRLREELGKAAGQLVAESTAELEGHAAERRKALHELSERLRRRERELSERIEREQAEAVQRIHAGFSDLERRALDQLERANERAWTRFSEAAALQFSDVIKQAREDAARRLSRELDRAVESFAREGARLLGEQAAQVAETGAQRIEKRMSRAASGIERQRDELLGALEQRLTTAESDFRRQLQAVAAEAEAERVAIETRVQALARRVDETLAASRERLAELESLRRR